MYSLCFRKEDIMEFNTMSIITLLIGLVVGGVVIFITGAGTGKKAEKLLNNAKKEADKHKRDSLLELKEESYKLKQETDKEIKEKSDKIFSELGLTMTSAINMFLRATIRENGIPFSLKIDNPNDVTLAAIEEGKKIANDKNTKGYNSVDDLRKALDL